jgi:hypothetical protein
LSRHREEQFEAPGKDSFLDVVANVVAILIILVIVVGSQASQIVIQKETARQEALATKGAGEHGEVGHAEAEARAIEQGVHELQGRIERQKFEISYRQAERDRVQLLVTVAEQRLSEHRDQLSEAERERYDLDAQLIASKGELAKLSQSQRADSKPPPIVLQHLPTPMARTVFGTEMHFRLLGHRLAYVPWQEMLERLKADAPQHVQKLKSSPRVELSLPAIGGFGARYILRKVDAQMQTRVGTATHSSIELENIYFVDAEANLGQPVAAALAPNSEFRSRLAEHKPQATTVTIWVYPDSFDDFRAIKAELFKLGYLTAARPLPEGYPIAGGPEGSRSSAE